jgi:hypothetical protein
LLSSPEAWASARRRAISSSMLRIVGAPYLALR